jgi:CDP-paratose 2-epimerase
MQHVYDPQARTGDHICYYSDLRKMKAHYPNWGITRSLEDTFREIYEQWERRTAERSAK